MLFNKGSKKLSLLLLMILHLVVAPLGYASGIADGSDKEMLFVDLRELSWERIDKKHADLTAAFAAVNRRRTATYVIGGAAVLGGLSLLAYRWFNPSATPASSKKEDGEKGRTVRETMDDAMLKDFEESRTFKGKVKQGIIIALSGAVVSFIMKRFDNAWENASAAQGNIFKRFWGDDETQIARRYIAKFLVEVELMQETLQRFETGIDLAIKSSSDQQLKALTCTDLKIAWESLISSFEDLAAVMAIVKKKKEPVDLFIDNPFIKNVCSTFAAIVVWADHMVQVSAVEKQEQIHLYALGRKLEIGAKQLIDSFAV